MVARDLAQIQCDYPNAIPETDHSVWVEEIMSHVEALLTNPGFDGIKNLMESSAILKLDIPHRFATLMSMATMAHPAMAATHDSRDHLLSAIDKTLGICQETASANVKNQIFRLTNMMVQSCRCPTGTDVSEFAEAARFLQMVNRYWRLASELVKTQTSYQVGFSPHPLLHLIENIRDRLRTCFTHLVHLDGAADVGQACDQLLSMLTEGEIDNLSVVEEWTNGELRKIERFLARANMTLGGREYALTAPEVYFIKLCEQLIAEHDRRIRHAWKQMLANADSIAAKQSTPKLPAPSQPDCAPPAVNICNWAEGGEVFTEAIKASAASRSARESGRPTSSTGQRPPSQQVAKGADWRDVQRRLLEIRDRGEPYTSIAKLATRLGCANATVQKAIKDSAQLKGWQARHLESKRSPRATSMNDVVTDNAEQSREADPATNAELDDVDAVFARLIEEANPNERAQLNRFDSAQRRKMVSLLQEDPDNYDRLLGRKP